MLSKTPLLSQTLLLSKTPFFDRTGLIIGLYGVVFHGEDARDVQKCVALQNNMKNLKKSEKKSAKKPDGFLFESRKMKCRGSSETRFGPSLVSIGADFEGSTAIQSFGVVIFPPVKVLKRQSIQR